MYHGPLTIATPDPKKFLLDFLIGTGYILSMASYPQAFTFDSLRPLINRDGRRLVGNNTRAHLAHDLNTGREVITIRLHGNAIVKLHEGGAIDISLAGWPTMTTRARINNYLPANPYSPARLNLYTRRHVQYLSLNQKRWDPLAPNQWGDLGAYVGPDELTYELTDHYGWTRVYSPEAGVFHLWQQQKLPIPV